MQALIVSNVVLWILVVVLAGIVVALLRQIGVLYERVAPAGALVVGHGPGTGDSAPVVNVQDLAGQLQVIGQRNAEQRGTLLVFLSPECPVCKTLLPALKSIAKDEQKWLDVILASDGARHTHESFIAEHDLGQFAYVLSSELGIKYRVGRLPHAVLIDADGIIRATGLVNSREHLESLFEASERGVASLQEFISKHSGDSRKVA